MGSNLLKVFFGLLQIVVIRNAAAAFLPVNAGPSSFTIFGETRFLSTGYWPMGE